MTNKEIKILFVLLEKYNNEFKNLQTKFLETGNLCDMVEANKLLNKWIAITEAFDALGLTAKIDKGEV